MKKQLVGYALRLPPDLKKKLEAEAATSGRSLNSEIVYRLQKTLDGWTQRA